MRITFAKTFSIINSVCQEAFFPFFLFPEREKKIMAFETLYFLKQKEKHLKVKACTTKFQPINSL